MALSIEVAGRYIKTFLDFCSLRPRKFIAAKNRDPSRYLSPYQFFVFSLIIGFFIYGAAFSLNLSVIHEATGQPPVASPNALAIQVLAFFVVMLVVNSLVIRAVSRIWPVRGSATFASIFELECYVLGIRLWPSMALTLLLSPWLTALGAQQLLTAGNTFLILFIPSAVIGATTTLFWEFPGVAVANGVSTLRVWAGVLFWSVALGSVVGIMFSVLIALRSLPA